MASDPDTALFDLGDPGRALALLTRLPAPGADGARGAASAWAWPVVGLIVGGLSGALASAAVALGLAPGIAAGLALGAGIVVTGALHEDGLADCADGFWGGRDRHRRLEIMKDSRIGAYGVLALILMIGLRWSALSVLIGGGALWAAALVPAALSRGAMCGVMATLPFARPDGYARHVGAPSGRAAMVGLGVATLAAVGLAGGAGIAALVAAGVAAAAVARIAVAKIGGQTGDVLGAAQQAAEVAALLTLAALMAPYGGVAPP